MISRAEKEANRLLKQLKMDCVPVDVEAIAQCLGVQVITHSLEAEVSGMLVIRGDRGTVAVNDSHSLPRQRFTVAHELGHFVLHKRDGSEGVFLDAFFRDSTSSEGSRTQEIEANAFAAALLMPEYWMRVRMMRRPVDPYDEAALKEMANEFCVSPQALRIRLANLGYILG